MICNGLTVVSLFERIPADLEYKATQNGVALLFGFGFADRQILYIR